MERPRKLIKRLKVQNYKSLEELDLSLDPLVVLVGPNASGKSNILDALRIVQELTRASGDRLLPQALESRGGYRSIVWGGEEERNIMANVAWEDDTDYQLLLGRSNGGQAAIKREVVTKAGRTILDRENTRWQYGNDSGSVQPYASVLSGATIRDDETHGVFREISQWAFYQFSPRLMRQPQQVEREYRLAPDGATLATVLHTLLSDGADAFDQIFEFVQSTVPTAEKLTSPITDDKKAYVALKERDIPAPIGSWGLSDGTLFSLALATALLTPEPPSLIGLEAPDTEFHPYVLESVAESLVLASERTQVMITTHSPYLLNHLPPESLVVVEKVDGRTQCRRVADREEAKEVMLALGVGKAWYSGHLGGTP